MRVPRFSLGVKLTLIVLVVLFAATVGLLFLQLGQVEEKVEEVAIDQINTYGEMIHHMVRLGYNRQLLYRDSENKLVQRHLIDLARSFKNICITAYDIEINGLATREEMQTLSGRTMLQYTIGRTGYPFVWDVSRAPERITVAVHPNIQGSDMTEFDFAQEAARLKNGFLEYEWANPDDPAPRHKVMGLAYFEPWEWVIAASAYRDEFGFLVDQSFYADNISQILSEVTQVRMATGNQVCIFDQEGQALLTPKERMPLVDMDLILLESNTRESDLIIREEQDGDKVITYFRRFEPLSWLIVVSTKLSSHTSLPMTIIRRGGLILSLVIALVTAVILSLLLHFTAIRPIRRMERMANEIASGNLEVRPLKVRSGDEIGRLSAAINNMSERLKEDVQEMVQAQETIRLERDRTRQYLDLAVVILLSLNQKGEIELINPKGCEILGRKSQDLIGRNWFDTCVPRDEANRNRTAFGEIITGQIRYDPSDYYESSVIDSKGRKRLIRWLNTTRTDGRGNIIGTFSSGEDITQSKQAEEDLRQSEAKFSKLFHASPIMMALVSVDDRRMIDANNEFCRAFGFTMEEMAGRTSKEMMVEIDPVAQEFLYHGLREKGKVRDLVFPFTTRDGDRREGILSADLISINGENNCIISVLDATELKRSEAEKTQLEDRLRQAQKMEAIGTLAGGIAHDFNNILSSIIGFTELSLMNLSDRDKLKNNLDQVVRAGLRARDLIDQILTFSRQSETQRLPMDLRSIVKETFKLLRASLPSTIEVRTEIPAEPCPVLANPTQIQQVIMNLCANAHHSMEETGGVLEAALDQIRLGPQGAAKSPGLEPGIFVRLRIKDTGEGILPGHLDRIFDPFFTTKERDKGTGLGLSVVHGIIKASHGAISVASQPGQGSVFTILLPFHRGLQQSQPGIEEEPVKGTGRILLVDDEAGLLRSYSLILTSLGYQVSASNSSPEALDTLGRNPDGFDLLITDLTMPGMTGLELAQRIKETRPDLPVILLTGFSINLTPEQLHESGIDRLVLKPVLRRELSQAVNQVLEAQ